MAVDSVVAVAEIVVAVRVSGVGETAVVAGMIVAVGIVVAGSGVGVTAVSGSSVQATSNRNNR